MTARPQYPRAADVVGMAAALELCLSWFTAAGVDASDDFAAVAVVRGAAAGAHGLDAVLEAGRTLRPRTDLPPAALAAHGQLRFALALTANALLHPKVDRATYRGWEQTFFAHLAASAGHLLAFAPRLAPSLGLAERRLREAALTAATAPAAPAKRRSADPKLRARALGTVMEVARTRAGMTVEAVAASVTASGARELSPATLRRIESGQLADHPAAPLAVQATGRPWEWAIDHAAAALRLAERIATVACDEHGEGWFERVAEQYGEATALAILRVASVSAAAKEAR